MVQHQQLLDNYEDTVFALLMDSVAREGFQQLENMNQTLLNDPEAAVPEKADRKILKTIRKYFAAQRRKSSRRSVLRHLRLVAIIVAFCILFSSIAMTVSEKFRIAVLNLVIEVEDRYTEFRMENGAPPELIPPTYFEVGWIPDGFHVTISSEDYVHYEDDQREWITILRAYKSANIAIDTEDAETTETVLRGLRAFVITKQGRTTILLVDLEGRQYYLVATSSVVGYEGTMKILDTLILPGADPEPVN